MDIILLTFTKIKPASQLGDQLPSILPQLLADGNPDDVGDCHGGKVDDAPGGVGLGGVPLKDDDNVNEECHHSEEHGDYAEYL